MLCKQLDVPQGQALIPNVTKAETELQSYSFAKTHYTVNFFSLPRSTELPAIMAELLLESHQLSWKREHLLLHATAACGPVPP